MAWLSIPGRLTDRAVVGWDGGIPLGNLSSHDSSLLSSLFFYKTVQSNRHRISPLIVPACALFIWDSVWCNAVNKGISHSVSITSLPGANDLTKKKYSNTVKTEILWHVITIVNSCLHLNIFKIYIFLAAINPSEIILICWFGANIILIMINVKNITILRKL